MGEATTDELLQINQRLLDAIARGDWETYQHLCDPRLTCFEPEASGQLVVGLEFHHFYFRLGGFAGEHHTTMCSPHVRMIGDVGIVSYVRLNQRVDPEGKPLTRAFEETRIWERREGGWRHVHFHRSGVG